MGGEGPESALTTAQPLAHADQQLSAHPESERLPGAAAPGSEFVQHARQRQGPNEFHCACGMGRAGSGAGT